MLLDFSSSVQMPWQHETRGPVQVSQGETCVNLKCFQTNGPTYSHPKQLVCTCRWCAKFWLQTLLHQLAANQSFTSNIYGAKSPWKWLISSSNHLKFIAPNFQTTHTSQFLAFWDHVTFNNFEVQANSRITRSLSSLRACCKCTSHRRKRDIQGGQDSNLKMGQGTTIYSMLSFVLPFWSIGP